MSIGTVKWFNNAKGFGFIGSEEFPKDVFVHVSALKASGLEALEEGQKVEFDMVQDRRDPSRSTAQNLRIIP